jgi:hypothetical protein
MHNRDRFREAALTASETMQSSWELARTSWSECPVQLGKCLPKLRINHKQQSDVMDVFWY